MTRIDRRRMLRLMASAGVAGATVPVLSACGSLGSSGKSDGKPIKIGVLVPQSGVYKQIGDDMTYGFELYMDLSGRRLGGRRVDLSYADEGDTPDTGKAAANKLLVEEQVSVLTGVASSATMTAIKDMVEKAQVPLVGSNASPKLDGVKYIWRTSYVNNDPGTALGRYVASQASGPVFLIAPAYEAGRDEVSGFRSTFEAAHGKMFDDPTFTPWPQTPKFEPYLAQIQASKASAVFAFYAGAQASAFVQAYGTSGIKTPLYAPGFLTEGAALLKVEGAAAGGIFTALNYSADLDNAENRTFATAYEKKYDALPTTYAMASYDAAAVLDKAIGLAGSDSSPQAINAAIGHVGQINSPRGLWQFNQNRTPQQKWYLRRVIQDGTVLSNVVISELITLG